MSRAINNYSDLGWFPLRHLEGIIKNSPVASEMNRQWLNLETFELVPPKVDTFLTYADEAVIAATNSRCYPIDTSLWDIERSLEKLDLSNEWAPAYPVAIRAYANKPLSSDPNKLLGDRIAELLDLDISENPVLLAQILVAIASISKENVKTCLWMLHHKRFPLDIAATATRFIKQPSTCSRKRLLKEQTLVTPTARALRGEATTRVLRSAYAAY